LWTVYFPSTILSFHALEHLRGSQSMCKDREREKRLKESEPVLDTKQSSRGIEGFQGLHGFRGGGKVEIEDGSGATNGRSIGSDKLIPRPAENGDIGEMKVGENGEEKFLRKICKHRGRRGVEWCPERGCFESFVRYRSASRAAAMTPVGELTALLPSKSKCLIYAVPLLIVSILLTSAGTFLLLDRARSFSPRNDVFSKDSAPAASHLFRLEGGLGGLAVGSRYLPS
jgi:hypothetical protein